MPPSLYDSVQAVLKAHDISGEKTRIHHHYLKGSIFCGDCGSRLCFTLAKGLYPYFYCLGRHQRRTSCRQPYLAVEAVEAAIERHYTTVRLPQGLEDVIRTGLKVELDKQHERAEPEISWARTRVTELQQERKRLARGVVTGTIPGDLARDEHQRIDHELEQAGRVLGTAEMIYAKIEQTLNRALDLLSRCDEVPFFFFFSAFFCAPGRTRTCDQSLRRRLLYPLSYGGQRPGADYRAAPRVARVRSGDRSPEGRVAGASRVAGPLGGRPGPVAGPCATASASVRQFLLARPQALVHPQIAFAPSSVPLGRVR